MKYTPVKIAFLQAMGLVAYIGLFSLFIQSTQGWEHENANLILKMSFFLLLFVISALISGSLILGYPLVLFFDSKKQEAMKVVLWSVGWLVVFAAILVLKIAFLQNLL